MHPHRNTQGILVSINSISYSKDWKLSRDLSHERKDKIEIGWDRWSVEHSLKFDE